MSEKEITFAEFAKQQDSQINAEFTETFDKIIQEFKGLINSNSNVNEQLVLACSLLNSSIQLNKALLEKLKENEK
ncbi:hypothetical protein CJP74_06365 [Psittacicella melopsittaci]|uniref:Uncharacterized protein n=1 Tax=Psittacicella melopsittaci TaxID=2028576 RepID=A0A3A1Y2Y7_9GAMM|nr:hypothetical protein [Psittacicella melopsittaci]RIY31790.1 hypothetical protein CJP74_06365 [Psittacicella melopsittaci]